MKYAAFLFLCIAYIAFGLQVDNRLTFSDIDAIHSLGVAKNCASIANYAQEVACIAAIQQNVQAIGGRQCAGWGDVIEPHAFLRRGYGCCFDRARFIEKAARYYGFETRHLFLVENHYWLYVANLLQLGQMSHATSEVLTSRGWLGVDANRPWLLISEENSPLSYEQALGINMSPKHVLPRSFDPEKVDIIYGLYSRHGFFFSPKLPGPEFVFTELLFNFD